MSDQHFHMEKWQVEEIAEKASRCAIHETFKLLGVDTKDQKSINDFRADLVNAHRMRRLSESSTTIAWRVLVTAVVSGLIAIIYTRLPPSN